ncbi:MAG: beta-galactosidase, partial [Candidatus Omnitrophica bacterium]|nr:beta-galactosidase [Candidatus Omnitrophota bacterium]
MRQITIKQKQITVGKKKISLVSGEVHYWRLNPAYWKTILEKVREMGLDIISTYVPWDYHEYKRGKFDFTGKTDETRDLRGFLELTRRMGFWLVIRPGPYIYSEWPNDGIPSYAYIYHRLHPQFLTYAENYLKHAIKIIKPFLASRKNGHIILLQADNEIDPWPDVFGDQYGLGRKPGLFQEFLRKRYNYDLDLLNRSWGTEYKNFEEAGPFIAQMTKNERGLLLKGDRELKRNLDYFHFKYFYSSECAKWNVATFKKLGIDIPIYLNLYPFFYAHD